MWRAFSKQLARAPFLTNLCTAVPLMVAGDLVAQRIEWGGARKTGGAADAGMEGKREPFRADGQRTLVMASYSAFVFTPLFFNVYKLQDRLLSGGRVWLALQKSVFSVVVGGIPANAAFLSLATLVEMQVFGKRPASGEGVEQVLARKVREDLPRVMAGSLSFWGPVNFCNFMLTPPPYRIVVASGAAVGWNTFLSLVQHKTFE